MCHQPQPHPKTQHPAPKLQPQVHHTNPPPLPSRGMHPPSLQPPPTPQTTAIAHPTHSPHPNSAPCEGSTRLHECVSALECCTQPAQDPVHLGEGGGGSWAPGAEPCVWDTSALPNSQPPRKPTEWQQRPRMGTASVLAPAASTPNAQPHTHTAAPSNGDNPVLASAQRGGGRARCTPRGV